MDSRWTHKHVWKKSVTVEFSESKPLISSIFKILKKKNIENDYNQQKQIRLTNQYYDGSSQ
jgi:hypothetical protein